MQKVSYQNMLKAVEDTNGKEATFKKNVDYFEMADGTFYTIDALTRKYGIGRSTVYNKARDAGIELTKIASFPCFKDDGNTFVKKERVYPATQAKHLKPMTSYGELVNIVKDIQRDIKACTLADGNTHSIPLELQEIKKDLTDIRNEIRIVTNNIANILDYLTKGKEDK